MRVLHVLHTSLPELCGYSIRTDYILHNQRQLGIEVAGVTSAQHSTTSSANIDLVNETTFYRTPPISGLQLPLLREWKLMRALRRQLAKAVTTWKPDIVHAYSPVIVGLPALQIARKHALPFVYEVRDLWENASVDRGKFGYNSVPYRLARNLETRVLCRADAVVTICNGLRGDIASRLSCDDRLFVVGNGVDTTKFVPRSDGVALKKRWNLIGKKLVGYIGSFQPYEGLELLLAALPNLLKHEATAHLMIAGSGGREDALRLQTRELGLEAHVTFTGRVPHEKVAEIYAMADLMVYPRVRTRTTILTTPLKPLEAMAMAKPVIVSDVEAMQELVQPGVTGGVFRAGDVNDLTMQALGILSATEDERLLLGNNARAWVLRERQWPALVSSYTAVYDNARMQITRRT